MLSLCMTTIMTDYPFNSISNFIAGIETLNSEIKVRSKDFLLFRGQDSDATLLPSIARGDSSLDTTSVERRMLNELKRRSSLIIKEKLVSDWDWLTYAQHHGMSTRLLDWTSNPLVAIWFAIQNPRTYKSRSYLYILLVFEKFILTNEEVEKASPFTIENTKVFRPDLNNKRIVAQQGWFTCHQYSIGKFQSLELDQSFGKTMITRLTINPEDKPHLLEELNILGINAQSIFPDIYGICQQINADHLNDLFKDA